MKLSKWKLFDVLGYKVYHDGVRAFHDSDARLKVAVCPRRSSKSYAAAYDVLDTVLLPNTKVWVVGPSYQLAEKEFRYIHEALVIKGKAAGIPRPVINQFNPASGKMFLKFPWGSTVEGKSAERPESLLGEAVDRIIYSEAAQLSGFIRDRYTAPTVITKKGCEIIATTPDATAEWVHQLWELGNGGRFSDIKSFSWDYTANPDYPVEEFERAKRIMGDDSPAFREQYLGEWVFYAGIVYHYFNEETHVIEPFDIPKNWTRYRGIDFGHRDPWVCLWAAVGPSQEVYIYREYYNRDGAPTREHSNHVKSKSQGEQFVRTVADSENPQSIEDLSAEGIPAMLANKDRTAGRMKVLEYMMPTKEGNPPFGQGRVREEYPKLYVFNTCVELRRELKYYRWKEGRRVEGDKERTEGDDHATDTLRYIIFERPSPFRDKDKIPYDSFDYWMRKSMGLRSNYINV